MSKVRIIKIYWNAFDDDDEIIHSDPTEDVPPYSILNLSYRLREELEKFEYHPYFSLTKLCGMPDDVSGRS